MITGYNLRDYAELAMQRYKRVFGNTMKARVLPLQKTEAWIGVCAVNRMTNLGMPVSEKVKKVANTGTFPKFFSIQQRHHPGWGHSSCRT